MSWITTTNTNFKAGDKVKIIRLYKELLDGVYTIEDLSIDKKFCVLKEIKPFKVIRTEHLKLVNVLEIE